MQGHATLVVPCLAGPYNAGAWHVVLNHAMARHVLPLYLVTVENYVGEYDGEQ